MKALKFLALLVVLAALAVCGAFWRLDSIIHSHPFQQQLIAAITRATGTAATIGSVDFSLKRGLTLRRVTVANPPSLSGELVSADEVVLRCRLVPLLLGRLEIQQVFIGSPVVTAGRDERGVWNFESLVQSSTPATNGAPAASVRAPTRIELADLALDDGRAIILKESHQSLATLQGVKLNTSLKLADGQLRGAGRANIATFSTGDKLFFRDMAGLLAMTTDAITLAPLRGRLARGDVTGSVTLKIRDRFQYAIDLKLERGDVDTLLQEAGKARVMSGKLEAEFSAVGTGGLATMRGNGRVVVRDGLLIKVPAQSLLALALQMPELRQLAFSECKMEFTLADNVMLTPVVKLTAPQLQLTGRGRVALDDYTLQHDFTLAIAKSALTNTPDFIRHIFQERDNGTVTLDFKVWGPYDAPKTDLTKRLVKGAFGGLIDEGLNLFK